MSKKVFTYMYAVLASILVLASCGKLTGEWVPKDPAENTGGDTPTQGDTPKTPVGEGEVKPAPKKGWFVRTLAGKEKSRGIRGAEGNLAERPSGIAFFEGTLYFTDGHLVKEIVPGKLARTVAGSTGGHDNGGFSDAKFRQPGGIAVSPDGSTLYVADELNHRIRKIDLKSKKVTTVAGSTKGHDNGGFSDAKFQQPGGIAVSPDGRVLYVADTYNHRIRKMDLKSKKVTTVAGSTGGHDNGGFSDAKFYYPAGIAVTSDGNALYVSELNRIRRVDLESEKVATIAGDKRAGNEDDVVGLAAKFDDPAGIALSPDDKTLYVAEKESHRIRKIDLESKKVTTFAGSKKGFTLHSPINAAKFNSPLDIAVSSDGNALYVTDHDNGVVCEIRSEEIG